MAPWRNGISLLLLKKYFTRLLRSLILFYLLLLLLLLLFFSAWPCSILYIASPDKISLKTLCIGEVLK